MPVIITDHTWSQSDSSIKITVPLKGVPSSQVDIFTTESYIKAHYQPFLFEVFLLHHVDENKSRCYLQSTNIIFELIKCESKEWESLEKSVTKEEKIIIKKDIHKKCEVIAKEKSEEKVIEKNELRRYAVRQAMDIDNKQHTLMDQRRDAERNKAMANLEKWRIDNEKHTSNSRSVPNSQIIEISDYSDEGSDRQSINVKPKKIVSEYVDKKKKECASRILPPIRGISNMEVNFSERVFPTPSRESTAEEESTWLRKMVEARRATGFVSEDLRPEEQDPQWCKEKGDEFFRDGNFLGAISAYTHGIKLSDKYSSLYANRAATHFALGNFNKCMLDCSTALDLMKPTCEGNRVNRARCITRRAAALARLGMLNKAIDEMKAAAKLLPHDEKIKTDIYDMERAWEQNPDSD